MSYVAMETNGETDDEHRGAVILMDFHAGGGLERPLIAAIAIVWTASLVLDEWYKYIQETSTFQADGWNQFDYLTLSTTVVSLLLRLVSPSLGLQMLAFSLLFTWCRVFQYLTSNQSIGLLVIMIINMFQDIALWALVSGIFLAAFTVAFVTISSPDAIGHGDGDASPITVALWTMHGAFDQHEVGQWNPQVGEPLLWLYLLISNIVLVNLLIAMMGDTYSEIKHKADEEWKFGRLRSVVQTTERMSPIPPPLNLPITLWLLVWRYLPAVAHDWLRGTWVDGSAWMLATAVVNPGALRIAQSRKQQVARRLLLAFKAQEETTEASSAIGRLGSIAGKVDRVEETLMELSLRGAPRNKGGRSKRPSLQMLGRLSSLQQLGSAPAPTAETG